MIECFHEWDDPECACALEDMIKRRKTQKRISELTGIDLTTDAARREYFGLVGEDIEILRGLIGYLNEWSMYTTDADPFETILSEG